MKKKISYILININSQINAKIKEVLLRKDWKIKCDLLSWVYKMVGEPRNEGVSVKGNSSSKEFKRRSSVGSRQRRGCNRSLIIEEERRLRELKCWEMRT